MSLRFRGGDRFQRGRGIGGLLRLAKGLFKPVVQTIGKAMKSNTGRAIGSALKTQAIDTAKNLATDVLPGNNLKEGLNREAKNIRVRAADGIQKLNTTHNAYVAEDDSEIEPTKQKRKQKQKVKSIEEDPGEIEPTKQKHKRKQKVKRRPRTKLEWEELLNLKIL